MLRGEAIPGINRLGEKLQMQTKALGWEIDDLLVSGHGTRGAEAPQLPGSCKSNVQVSSADSQGFVGDDRLQSAMGRQSGFRFGRREADIHRAPPWGLHGHYPISYETSRSN